MGFGVGVWGLGFGVWGLGFGVWGVGCGVWGVGCGVWGLGLGLTLLGFLLFGAFLRVNTCGCWVLEGLRNFMGSPTTPLYTTPPRFPPQLRLFRDS